jgi:hypothetical protein
MSWQNSPSLQDTEGFQIQVKGLLDGDKIGSGMRVAKDVLGIIGQGIAEAITGGRPKSFLVEPPLPTRLRTDIYLPETDAAVEVKAGGSKVEQHQILKYQKGLFSGGLSVMFVQNPFNGEIGPDVGDYIVLRQTNVPFVQVWFTSVRSEPLRRPKEDARS